MFLVEPDPVKSIYEMLAKIVVIIPHCDLHNE